MSQKILPKEGDWVWVSDKPSSLPYGAKVLKADKTKVSVEDDEGVKHKVGREAVRKMHQSCIRPVEDMIALEDCEEAAILRNLQLRYKKQLIYTYTGSILAAVNPYKVLPIYTSEYIDKYFSCKFGEHPPHIFAMADNCYHNMRRYQKDQSLIISGESGAGKTESTKLLLQFLAAVSGQHSWIEQQILESNTVLEAFGNAKTVRNNNSSRFGKYVVIEFDAHGCITSAKIQQYLLEKSRIVHQLKQERNYHIFYCMLDGMTAEEKQQLDLTTATHFHYLNQGGEVKATDRQDKQDFVNVKSAMKVLMMDDEQIWSMFKTLAAVLHLGNVQFTETMVNHTDAVVIKTRDLLAKIATLIQVPKDQLTSALTTVTMQTSQELVTKQFNLQTAESVRSSLAKDIYTRLFVWLVNSINHTIEKRHAKHNSIGLLDIFGFESFGVNSFEQLCINYANECLQQFFVKNVFQLEQADYLAEGIQWSPIEFVDNRDVLALLKHQKLSVFSLLDEETNFPNGSDRSLLTKLHQTHHENQYYNKPKSEATLQFGVKHFAGMVTYTTKGFLEKNQDVLSSDLMTLMRSSKSAFVRQLYTDVRDSEVARQRNTVSSQFISSLDELLEMLSGTQPFFVRCIKPNAFKKPLEFDRDLCHSQIQYSGMLETLQIRKNGYPVRPLVETFVDRYKVLTSGIGTLNSPEDYRRAASKIAQSVLEQEDFLIGRTKVFLKDGQDAFLEQRRNRMKKKKIVYIQKIIRGYIVRVRNKPRLPEPPPIDVVSGTTKSYSLSGYLHPDHQHETERIETASVDTNSEVYSHSDEPITAPILKKIETSKILAEEAIYCFLAIMKYMGDYHTSRPIGVQLTDDIFTPLTEHDILIDEVYCQIVKQMTGNENPKSEQRGWELLWMITGMFAPSQNLLAETMKFFKAWAHQELADICLERLKRTLNHGSHRKFPPHRVEVQAIQQNITKLFYKVYFPDNTFERFRVDSNSRAKDVCRAIAKHYKMKSVAGFSLYVELGDKLISVQDNEFVFDVGKHWTDKMRRSGIVTEEAVVDPKVHFMKKLWIDVVPGKDIQADIKFYYHQEVHKYLKGYYSCTREEALVLAVLLYKIKYPTQEKNIKEVYNKEAELIPQHVLRKATAQDWEKKLIATLRKIGNLSVQEAKVNFLDNCKWETFGSSFFEVRQVVDYKLPEWMYLAINAKGLFVINQGSKEVIENYSLTQITHWSSDLNSFHITIGTMYDGRKMNCQTSLGYKIADLLESYKAALGRKHESDIRTLQRNARLSQAAILESTSL